VRFAADFAGSLNGAGCSCAMQLVSSHWIVPVRNNWGLIERVQPQRPNEQRFSRKGAAVSPVTF
jgi:hypothetical protein